jgi:hypothetical protein
MVGGEVEGRERLCAAGGKRTHDAQARVVVQAVALEAQAQQRAAGARCREDGLEAVIMVSQLDRHGHVVEAVAAGEASAPIGRSLVGGARVDAAPALGGECLAGRGGASEDDGLVHEQHRAREVEVRHGARQRTAEDLRALGPKGVARECQRVELHG